MKNLQQKVYEDDNGNEISADKVDYLTSYMYIADGFYNWSCAACGEDHSDRWHRVSGRVLKCQTCGKMNLLVRTNCTEINEALSGKWRQPEIAAENERLKGVQKWNEQELQKIKAQVVNAVNVALAQITRP